MTKLNITPEILARAKARAAEANAAGALRAKTEVHCTRCGRVLTHPESIAARIGPECSTKGRVEGDES
jgi:hypothetical protein